MIELTLPGPPRSKMRHRLGKRCYAFDPQKSQKMKDKFYLSSQMRNKRILKAHEGPLCAVLSFHMPIPKSWSKKRLKNVLEKNIEHVSKPDIDNLQKYILDILNGIGFEDDRLVCKVLSEKIYSREPKTKIILYPWRNSMITEHATTIHEKMTEEDLRYLIKKANRLGRNGREIAYVYQKEDEEGTHIFFEVDGLKQRVAYA